MTMRPNKSAGYTLIELLLAMGLFAALSTGLIALLARSSEFLASGASQTETMDSLQTFAESFSGDVATMASRPDSDTGRPDVRLYCDWIGTDVTGDNKADVTNQRLFFVRFMPGEATSGTTREAGAVPGAKDYMNQVDDEAKAKDGKLRAPGGLMEVFWTALPDDKEDLAVMKIWRGYRAPPGGPDTLLPVKAWRDPQAGPKEKGPTKPADVRAAARPVLSGVLYFGVEFWSRKTTTWDSKVSAKNGGPLATWDSTRGILPQGDDLDSFPWSKKSSPNDASSLDDPTDDTFPRKVRVTCVVEELGRNARVGYLGEDLLADAKSIVVSDTRFFPTSETSQRFVKIDTEWLEVGQPEGNTIPVVRRGARGTAATTHSSGTKVHHGRSFISEYDIASFRDTYRDELPTLTGRGAYGK
jgi:hypothetical protein